MATRKKDDTCTDCGAPARVWLRDRLLCDGCFDQTISRATGWPELPDPPLPETLAGPDGRKHHLRYRLWRSGGGIVAEAEEYTAAGKLKLDGYHFKIIGSHWVVVSRLVAELREMVQAEIGRLYLKRRWEGGPWVAEREELRGRFTPASGTERYPYDVIVDGRRLSWEELGSALERYEGFQFRLIIEQPTTDEWEPLSDEDAPNPS